MNCKIGKLILLSTLVVGLLNTAPAPAAEPSREYQVKAAFIYNFTQFIEWPENTFPSADSPFVIVILGADPFNGALDQAMEGKRVGTRPVVVKHISSESAVGPCQILFVPLTEEANITNKLGRIIGNGPVLAVGEGDNILPIGGIVRFFTEDKKIRFEINTRAAEERHLKISSKLLKLARIYKK